MIQTYLLKSLNTGKYYVGITKNPERRLELHNNGAITSIKESKPWKLVYKKAHNSYQEARKHERWLKKKNQEYKSGLAATRDGTG